MKTITLQHLEGACPDQRELFARTFPKGAPVTEESARQALAAGLNVRWLDYLLPAPAWKEYELTKDLAWDEYERVRALAWKEYERAAATALVAQLSALPD